MLAASTGLAQSSEALEAEEASAKTENKVFRAAGFLRSEDSNQQPLSHDGSKRNL